MRKPNFFLVGHTRSSGTSLEINLNQHPEVFVTSYKKGYFGFDTDLKSETDYLMLFQNANDEKYVGERCSDYIFCPSTASKLKKYSPNAKILLIIRNPIDVMYSLHSKMHLVETIEPIENFEKALELESQRINENQTSPNSYPPQILYRNVVRYPEQISRYYDEFGSENVKIVIFDELVKNPLDIYEEIFDFLGIDSSFIPNFQKVNENRNPRSHLIQSIVKKNKRFFSIFSKVPGISSLYTTVNLPISKRSLMDEQLKIKLKKDLLPEIKELSKLISKDLTFWCE